MTSKLPAPSPSFSEWLAKAKLSKELTSWQKSYLHSWYGPGWVEPVVDIVIMPTGHSKLSELKQAIAETLAMPTGKIWIASAAQYPGDAPEWIEVGKASPVSVHHVTPGYESYPYLSPMSQKAVLASFKTHNKPPKMSAPYFFFHAKGTLVREEDQHTSAPENVNLAPIAERLKELGEKFPPMATHPVVIENQQVKIGGVPLGEVQHVSIQQGGSGPGFVVEVSLSKAAYAALKSQYSIGLPAVSFGWDSGGHLISKELP